MTPFHHCVKFRLSNARCCQALKRRSRFHSVVTNLSYQSRRALPRDWVRQQNRCPQRLILSTCFCLRNLSSAPGLSHQISRCTFQRGKVEFTRLTHSLSQMFRCFSKVQSVLGQVRKSHTSGALFLLRIDSVFRLVQVCLCCFCRGVLIALVFVLHPDSLMMSGACLKSVSMSRYCAVQSTPTLNTRFNNRRLITSEFSNPSESRRKFNKPRLDALSIPHYVIKKGRCHGARHGKTEEQKEYHMARKLTLKVNILQVFTIDFSEIQFIVNHNSQLAAAEQKCKEWDELAKEDHTYRLTPEEKRRYQGQWYLTLNKSGKNAPMKLRSDFRAAVSMKNPLHHESGEQIEEPISPEQTRQHMASIPLQAYRGGTRIGNELCVVRRKRKSCWPQSMLRQQRKSTSCGSQCKICRESGIFLRSEMAKNRVARRSVSSDVDADRPRRLCGEGLDRTGTTHCRDPEFSVWFEGSACWGGIAQDLPGCDWSGHPVSCPQPCQRVQVKFAEPMADLRFWRWTMTTQRVWSVQFRSRKVSKEIWVHP